MKPALLTTPMRVTRQFFKSHRLAAFNLLALSCCLSLLNPRGAYAQSATGWTGTTDGLWNFGGNWTNGIPNTNPPPSGGQAARILNFGPLGNTRPNSTNNMPGATGVSLHRIFFNTGATNYTLWLFPGTNGATLNDFGGNIPKVQNDSTTPQTIDMSFRMSGAGNTGVNRAAEINPINADLVFTPNSTVGIVTNTELRFYSQPGFTTTFYGPITNTVPTNTCALMTAAGGGLGATVVFFNSHTFTNTFINNGTVRLATNNVTGAPFYIGDTNLTPAGAVLQMDNGFNNNSALFVKAGSTNSRTIGNTAVGSGEALFSGPLSLGTNLFTSANPAGTLKFSGAVDFQNPAGTGPRNLTASGAGDTVFNGGFTNASTGSSVLTKTNSGTLSLLASNAVRVLYNHWGGVISITNANALGVPTGVNYPDKLNFYANATLRTVNTMTLGRNAATNDNAGFRINGGATGTFDVTADTLTLDGVISEFGTGAGSLNKVGPGTLVLAQPNTYSGATVVSNGTLLVNGSISNSAVTVTTGAALGGSGTVSNITINSGGTVTPGNAAIGTLTSLGSSSLNGTAVMEINRNGSSPLADKITLTSGTLSLGGTLTVANLGAVLQVNDTFDLFDGTLSGSFTTLNLPTLSSGLTWDTSQLNAGGNGTIKVSCDGSLTASAGSNQTICSGGGVVIGGSPTANAGSGSYSYAWSPSTGLSSTNIANPTASPANTTIYTVTVTDANGCTAISSSITVTVTAAATAGTGGNQTLCSSSSTTALGGSVGGGATGGFWASSGTGTFLPDTNTLNAIYHPSPADITAGTVTLTLTSTGQTSPCGAATAQVIVTINAAATANAGTNQTVPASTTTVALTGTVGGGATNGTWTTAGTGSFDDTNSLTAIYTPSAADKLVRQVTLTLTSTGQSSPCGAAVSAMTITFNSSPVATNLSVGALTGTPASLQIIDGKYPPTDADGDPLTVTALGAAANGIVTTDGTNATYTATNGFTGTDSFTYTVSDNFGGSATATVTVNVITNGPGFNQLSAAPNGSDVVLNYLGIPGSSYALDRAFNLASPVWIPQITNPAAVNGNLIFTNTPAPGTNNFWRTRYVP